MTPAEIIAALLRAGAAAVSAAAEAYRAEVALCAQLRAELEAKAKAALAT